MSFLSRSFFLLVCLLAGACQAQSTIRICADPDNLPFSNRQKTGFDNRIAELLIRKIGKQPVFVWARARRGFLRERFNRNDCDLLMGVPQGLKRVRETVPYYRSGYVFVTRKQENLRLASFSDPAIGSRRIGLQILEEDFSPPSLPLIRYGHAAQLVGFESFGRNAGEIIHAVAIQRVGLAVVWGPLAGYYVSRERIPLFMTLSPAIDSGVPFRYSMAIGVHQRDVALADALNRAIQKESMTIARILSTYHVPQIGEKDDDL
jgi:mxaJ protein